MKKEDKEEVQIRLKSMMCTLKPITARQYADFSKEAIHILNDYEHGSRLWYQFGRSYSCFQHPKIYAVLKRLFGESTTMYDDYKCSFGFTFLISLENLDNKKFKSKHLLNFTDFKGGLDFRFMKILSTHENHDTFERNKAYTPEECHFPKEDMRCFMEMFLFYITFPMFSLEDDYDKNFTRTLDDQRMIYGYRNGAFFLNFFEYEDDDKFHELKYSLSEDPNIPFNATKPN